MHVFWRQGEQARCAHRWEPSREAGAEQGATWHHCCLLGAGREQRRGRYSCAMGPCREVSSGIRGLQLPGPLGARRRGHREAAAQGARCAVMALCCVAVHGAWEEWSPWSLCSVTCGRGARTRTRRCVAPQHGGKACEGPELQAKPCSIATCLGQYHSPVPLLRVPSPGTARKTAEGEGCAPSAGAAVMRGSGIAAMGTWDSVGTQGCIPCRGPHGEPAVLQGPEPPPQA